MRVDAIVRNARLLMAKCTPRKIKLDGMVNHYLELRTRIMMYVKHAHTNQGYDSCDASSTSGLFNQLTKNILRLT